MKFPKTKRLVDEFVLENVRKQRCCICNRFPVDASHIKSRGSGGPDKEFNVVPHCRNHHVEWHQIGQSRFLNKYPAFALKLELMGWIWDANGDLTHPDLWNED